VLAQLATADTLRVPAEFPTIQAAVDAAVPGDQVLVAPGLYEERIIISVHNIALTSEVASGAVLREEWVVFSDANDVSVTGFDIQSTTTLTHGAIPLALYGDGFFVDSCKLSKGRPCVSLGGNGTLRNSTILGAAGGLWIGDGANVVVEGCDFIANVDLSIGGAGALRVVTTPSDTDGCDVTLTDCRFISNQCGFGAAIYMEGANYFSRVTVERALFHDNVAVSGPAVYCLDSELIMRSSTVTENAVRESNVNGAVFEFDGFHQRTSIIDRTIVAFNDGPVMKCVNGTTPMVSCCDLFGNGSDGFCGGDSGNNFSSDPLFCAADSGDFSLQHGSPCSPPHSPEACGWIGAFSVGCVSSVEPTTWGAMKYHYVPSGGKP
jgi:predicted outer membrane repeat protein